MNHSEYSWRARTPAWLAGLALMLAWPGGCKQEAAIGAEPVATGGAGVGGASGALGCPSGKGPQMALLPAHDGTNYCMDARETTRAEYDAFVKAKAADTSGQPSACAWNTSFTPTLVTEDADTFPSPYYCYDTDWNDMRPDQAVGCVDFCDALAYCEWAGKRLCGQVGKGAERVNQFTGTLKEWAAFVETAAKTTQSEFINACTQGGKTTYPYGDTYEPGVCIDAAWLEAHGRTAMDVTDTASRSCHGTVPPFDQVYDLSGSVTEWQGVCYDQDEVGWLCLLSGSPSGESPARECKGFVASTALRNVEPDVGFRCCAGPAAW